jgi:hypothetical protein
MSSPARITANRSNARLSTGPRTAAGKARASRNATKFGLFSGTFTHPGEEKDYAAIRASLRDAFDPQTADEQAALDQICGAVWRLRRCNQLEAAIITPFDQAIRRPPARESHPPEIGPRSESAKAHSQKRTHFPGCSLNFRNLPCPQLCAASSGTFA